jgi:diguanylate cyclase (GGDEF)-like protein
MLQQIQSHFCSRKFRNFSFIFLDIDHFKSINDTYGHATGDRVLRGLGQGLRKSLRPYDLIGRYGGEEFLVLLPDTSLPEAKIVAEKLRQMVASLTFSTGLTEIHVTVSLGISALVEHQPYLPPPVSAQDLAGLFAPSPPLDWDQWKADILHIIDRLIELADTAMYAAKKFGRNQSCVYEEKQDESANSDL